MRPPEAVYLHVGHGKTGSSFLQSALANSIPDLAARGIAYPLDPEVAARVARGAISSGNLEPAPGHVARFTAQPVDQPRLLISSEAWFNHLHPSGLLEALRHAYDGPAIHLLLCVRDPLDHAVSQYLQSVKRGGATEPFDAALARYNMPAKVARFLTVLEGQADVTVRVCNYSRHRAGLLALLADWLGVPKTVLHPPAQRRVNRSLTRAETEWMRLFNARLGVQAGALIADPLCACLPDVVAEDPPATPDVVAAFLQRMARMIDRQGLARWLAPSEAYHLPDAATALARFGAQDPPPPLALSPAQMAVMVRALSAAIRGSDPEGDPGVDGPA